MLPRWTRKSMDLPLPSPGWSGRPLPHNPIPHICLKGAGRHIFVHDFSVANFAPERVCLYPLKLNAAVVHLGVKVRIGLFRQGNDERSIICLDG